MNFLAHIYLSGDDEEIRFGNFIADSIKGKQYLQYSDSIQKGILLHRGIDSFTDRHSKVKEAKKFFSAYGHYSGVIVDIIFDHFLAKHWLHFHSTPLQNFTEEFYSLLDYKHEYLPGKVKAFYPKMRRQNWLLKYATEAGISDILYQMNIRTRNISKMNYAIVELRKNYNELEQLFFDFFEDLEGFVFLKQTSLKVS